MKFDQMIQFRKISKKIIPKITLDLSEIYAPEQFWGKIDVFH
jgi:hypothetical protein